MSVHLDRELSAYLDGELAGDALARAEAHLGGCDECRVALEDLRRVVRRAATLDDRPPERDLWNGIAAQIASARTDDVVPLAPRRRRFAFTAPQLAAAAVALMAVSAGAGLLLRPRAPAAVRADRPAIGGVAVPAGLRPTAAASYDAAIADLERSLAANRGRMDSASVAVVENSLRVIDEAIAQARRALARQPDNLYLNSTLQRALDRKLTVLRQVVTLTVAS